MPYRRSSESHGIHAGQRLMMSSLLMASALSLMLSGCGPQTIDARRAEVVAAAAVMRSDLQKVPRPPQFAEAKMPSSPTGGACNFDLIAGLGRDTATLEIDRVRNVRYTGWSALSVKEGILPERVHLVLVGDKSFAVQPAVASRSDVASYFRNPSLENAGFAIDASASEVPPGEYVLKIYMQTGDKLFECGTTKKVGVK